MKEDQKSKSKSKTVKPIPEGMHTVTPFLVVNQGAMLLEFIKKAFNGKVTAQLDGEDGKVMHATIKIGDSTIMVSDASERIGPVQSMLHVYVDDVDKVYNQALNAKGQSIREPQDEFYGDRSAGILDPWENQWWIATHVEDVTDDEIRRRAEKFQKQEA